MFNNNIVGKRGRREEIDMLEEIGVIRDVVTEEGFEEVDDMNIIIFKE